MFRLTLRRSVILLAAVGAILFLPSVGAFVFVDGCLDAGGSVNYVEWTCSMNHSFPNPPTGTWLRAPTDVAVAVAGAAALALVAIFAAIDWRQRRRLPPAG